MDDKATTHATPDVPTDTIDDPDWCDVGDVASVKKARRTVIEAIDGGQIVIIAHDGEFHALDNICIHRERELHKGVVLNGRLICPGHQWAFDLTCGWEAVKQRCQPTFNVRVTDDGRVEVDLASRAVVVQPPKR